MNSRIVVLMAVYNEEKYIVEAIHSFLNQGDINAVLVIIDDFSTDNTYNLAKQIESPQIILLRNDKKGKNNAYNLGFNSIKGDFYCFLGGDDILESNSLLSRYNCIGKYDNRKIAVLSRLQILSINKRVHNVVIPKNYKKGNINGGTICFTKELAKIIFPIPSTLPNEDLWVSLNIKYFSDEIKYNPDIVLKYRIHSENSYGINLKYKERTEKMHDRAKVYSLFLEKYYKTLNNSQKQELYAKISLEDYRYRRAYLSIIFSLKCNLISKITYLVYSSPVLYKLKCLFYNLFAGRS